MEKKRTYYHSFETKGHKRIKLYTETDEKVDSDGNSQKIIHVFNRNQQEILSIKDWKVEKPTGGLVMGESTSQITCYDAFFAVITTRRQFTMSEQSTTKSFVVYGYDGKQILSEPNAWEGMNTIWKVHDILEGEESENE